jgi:hypothetical protein
MKTILITGNGAVENGWLPVVNALKKVYPREEEIDPDFANFVFAAIIYKLRWLDIQLGRRERNAHLLDDLQNKFKRTVSEYHEIKKEIINELDKAHESGFIRPRDDLKLLHDLYLNTETKIITTNWDSTIMDFVGNRHGTVFLHGCTSETLFLPSEGIEEGYRKRAKLEVPYDRLAWEFMSCLQDYGERLVIYGLSLSPLDVELVHLIADGFAGTSNPKSVVIVDPKYEPVKKRLCFLLPHIEPECYLPEDLGKL